MMTSHTVSPPVAGLGVLERIGWRSEDPLVRETAPTLARGHNLVAVVPPAPLYAAPLVAGILARPAEDLGGRILLLLSPAHLLGEWAVLAAALGEDIASGTLIVRGPGAARRHLEHPSLRWLVGTPEVTLELRRRSQLAPERLAAVILAFPEQWESPEAMTELLPEIPRDTQRVVITSDLGASGQVVERHAWRALTVGAPAEPHRPVGPVRVVAVPWSRRFSALAEVAETLEPESLAVWTVDHSRHQEIRRALTGLGIPIEITSRSPAPAQVVVAFDPPSHARLSELIGLGAAVLLMPPGTERYLAGIASPRHPLLLAGLDPARGGAAARRRARLTRVLEGEDLEPEYVALGSLFERYDPAAVAAALYRLWRTEETAAPAPEALPAGTSRIWVSVGRKDNAGPNDLVGLLANELQIERGLIGRIEVRETYSLIEVPAEQAEQIATALNGRMVRRRRLVARMDRKR